MMLKQDIARLKSLAQAATAGPWQKSGVRSKVDLSHTTCFTVGTERMGFIYFPVGRTDQEHLDAFRDANFVAAANPQAILELIKLVENGYAQT